MSKIINAEHVFFSYEGETPEERIEVLRDISFDIEEGSFTAILGRNGSGKSTLAKLLCMVETPDSGRLTVDGVDVTDENVSEDDIYKARSDVGMVFQNPDNQIVATIVEDDVAFGPENLGIPSDEIRRRVDGALGAVGMSEYARHSASRLSGGQKQRVAIAGAIAMDRKCIIFDESTAMLDPLGRRDVMKNIVRLNREEGVTVILITHYMNEASCADRVIVMENGSIIMDGKPKDIFTRAEELWEAGLDVPQSTELLWRLRDRGLSVPLDAFSPGECAAAIKRALEGRARTSEALLEASAPEERDGAEYAAEFRNVSFTYNKGISYEKVAVDRVTLGIEKGCVTGLIGSTGSGKSTLIRMLNGLLKQDSGDVIVDGVNIWDKGVKMREIRFKVGLVMQYPEYQLFDETVSGDISFGPKNMGISGDELKERVAEAAQFSGLDEDLLSKSPFDLSGGQKRRAALAGVMAMRPSLLILDEPAAGLDPAGRREILGRIKKYQRESGNTVLIVSHSMEDVAKYCDRLAVLSNGKIIMYGDTKDVFSHAEELRNVGLDVPEITNIAQAMAEAGCPIGDDIYTVPFASERIAACYGL